MAISLGVIDQENDGNCGDIPEERPPKLRRLKHLDAEPKPSQQPKKVSNTAEQTNKRYKYTDSDSTVKDQPDYLVRMRTLAAQEDPPNYSTQGEDIGRRRGRKAKGGDSEKKTKKGKGLKGGQGKKGKKGVKGKKANKSGKKQGAVKQVSTDKTKGTHVGKFKKLKQMQRAKMAKEQDPEGDSKVVPPTLEDSEVAGQPYHHGPKRATPPHVTAHMVYSSAYRRNQHQGVDFARSAGKMAASMFRETGFVDDLCGVFRATPRARKSDLA